MLPTLLWVAIVSTLPGVYATSRLIVSHAIHPTLLEKHDIDFETLEDVLLKAETQPSLHTIYSTTSITDNKKDEEALYIACGEFNHAHALESHLLHHYIILNQNAHVAYVQNKDKHLCVLTVLTKDEAEDIRVNSLVQIHRYPSFMKIHESILDHLDEGHSAHVPSVWSATERKHKRLTSEASIRKDMINDASVLSIEIAPVYLKRHGFSIKLIAEQILNDLTSSASVPEYLSSIDHTLTSRSWSRITNKHQSANIQDICCQFAQNAEITYTSRSIDITNLSQLPPRCMVHLVHHSVKYSQVLRVVIHPRPTLMNYEARGLTESGTAHIEPYRMAGLTGSGQICGVGDSGVNDVSCFFLDDSKAYPTVTTARSGEVQPLRRKIIQYMAYADATEDEAGHGTHVCGSIAGNSNGPELSSMDGMAPDAKIALFDLGMTDKAYLKVPAVGEIFDTAYSAGARVHTNSWGNPGGIYGQMSYDVDEYLFEHDDFLVLFAAGNSGHDGANSIIAPGNAKNCLSVGAAQLRGVLGDKPFTNDDRIASFSSIGPTFDGRIKPDIVAPGDFIMSAYAGPIVNLNNAMSAGAKVESTCAAHQMSGTSMATPVTAGSCLIVRQYFMDANFWGQMCRTSNIFCLRKSFEPSGYLLKALFIHSGRSVSRYSDPAYDAEPTAFASFRLESPPDNFQGYGAVTLKNILPLENGQGLHPSLSLFVYDGLVLKSHNSYKISVTFNTANPEPLKVTIAWFDPPSIIGSVTSLLLHDIDLVVKTSEGNLHWGNEEYADHDRKAHMKGHGDSKNPNEQVYIAHPKCAQVPCEYEIFIHAHSLFAKASQNVAVVITSSGIVSDPVLTSANWFGPDEDDIPRSRHHNQTYSPFDAQIAASLRGGEFTSTSFNIPTCGHLRLVEATLKFNHLHCLPGESLASYIELTLQGPSGKAVSIGGSDSSVGKAKITTEWPSSWNEDTNGEYTALIDLTDAKIGGIGTWTMYIMNSFSLAGKVNYDLNVTLLFYGGPNDRCAPTSKPSYNDHDEDSYKIPQDELLSDFDSSYEIPFHSLGLGVKAVPGDGSTTSTSGVPLIQDRITIGTFPLNTGILQSIQLTLNPYDVHNLYTFGTDGWLLAVIVTAPDERVSVQVGGYHWLGRKDHFYYRHWPDPWIGRYSGGLRWASSRDVSAAGLTGSYSAGESKIRNKGSPSAGKWIVELAMGANYPRNVVNFTGTVTLMFNDMDCQDRTCVKKVIRLASFSSQGPTTADSRENIWKNSLSRNVILGFMFLVIIVCLIRYLMQRINKRSKTHGEVKHLGFEAPYGSTNLSSRNS